MLSFKSLKCIFLASITIGMTSLCLQAQGERSAGIAFEFPAFKNSTERTVFLSV